MTKDEMAGWHHGLDGRDLSELQEMVMDREAWRAAIHGALTEVTQFSSFQFSHSVVSDPATP